nr:NADP dependent malic enzyme [Hymenolepis microstoma]
MFGVNYRDKFFPLTFQGTASVILSGLLTASRITKRQLKDENIVCYGAGESMIGFVNLLVECFKTRFGLNEAEAKSRIWMVDSRGLIVEGRSSGGISAEKALFARPKGSVNEIKELKDVICTSKATILIGASAVSGAFTEDILQLMAKQSDHPLIFALSNPTHKAECTAQAAYSATQGKCIFAIGSSFDPVNEHRPGQANNSYFFPGLCLVIVGARIQPVAEEDFIVAAETLSKEVEQSNLDEGCIYPSLSKIRSVSYKIACEVARRAYTQGRVRLMDEKGNKIREEDLEAAILKMASYPEPPK